MKTIIAGSRTITDESTVYNAVTNSKFDVTEVVSGGAKGVDMLGENWAFYNKVPVSRFPANWTKFGLGAGHVRNAEMAMYADALIAVWDGYSKGTANMINLAKAKGLQVYVEMV